jgi:(p)ppGpp synthase/HD superfamily hydrolase
MLINLDGSESPFFLSWRFGAAMQIAFDFHRRQIRKGTSIPYIAHLMGVCALVLEAGGDEDQAIAALLHDAVEDQGGLSTLDTIRHVFGERVALAVESCSDSTASDPAKKLPWRERKEQYLAHLRSANRDALIVAAADKLHNARAILSDYRELGDNLWARFNASGQDQLWYYRKLAEMLCGTSAPKVLVNELERVTSQLEQLMNAPTRNLATNASAESPTK